jgi:hypothetical protein
MANERSLIAVDRAHEGLRRFDYFVLAVAIALCAYVGQTISPEKLGWSAYTMEAISVVILVASAFCGFKRIEKQVRLDALNHEILDAHEKRGAIVAHETNSPGMPFINAGTGDVYSPEELKEKKDEIEADLSKFYTDAQTVHDTSETYRIWRNGLLGLGFVGLFLAKVLAPYLC